MDKLLSLDRGHYLGKVVEICHAGGIIAGVTTYPKEAFTSQMHCHDNLHISFVMQGGSFEKRVHNEYERIPGDIMFYHAGEAHQNIQKFFPSKNINLEIDNDFLKKHSIAEATINNAITQNPDGKFLMIKIYKELLANDDFSAASINILFLDLISNAGKLAYNKVQPTWPKIIYELMKERWNEKLTLEDLAVAASVNPTTISKHFRRYFSCTFGEYMRKLKVEKSLAIIKTNSSSLTEVAYSCNFADQSHFTRTFKQLTGLLPKQYKKLRGI